jgi:ABC-type siderophore export system fused ATPase/permease subunit
MIYIDFKCLKHVSQVNLYGSVDIVIDNGCNADKGMQILSSFKDLLEFSHMFYGSQMVHDVDEEVNDFLRSVHLIFAVRRIFLDYLLDGVLMEICKIGEWLIIGVLIEDRESIDLLWSDLEALVDPV